MAFVNRVDSLLKAHNGDVLYSIPSPRLSLQTQSKEIQVTVEQSGLIELVKKMADGDESAMTTFYDATVNRVFGMALKVVLRAELAEEVVGNVYLQVWRQATSFDPERSSPIGWLMMICRSRALDMLRREKSATREQYQEDEQRNLYNKADENPGTPLDDIIESETSQQVAAALQLLNKKQRQTIALAFYRDMSHQEIADHTGQPLGTVKSNIRRAQDILRNVLSRDDLSNPGSGGLYEKA